MQSSAFRSTTPALRSRSDNFRTPLDEPVLKALGLPRNGRTDWVVEGEHVPTETLVEAHLDFYRERPEVVAAALREHVRRLRRLAVLNVRRALSHLDVLARLFPFFSQKF